MREQWERGNGEEDRVGTLRGEFLCGLIFAAAAADDGFLQGEKGDLLGRDGTNNERDIADKWEEFIPRPTRVTRYLHAKTFGEP